MQPIQIVSSANQYIRIVRHRLLRNKVHCKLNKCAF